MTTPQLAASHNFQRARQRLEDMLDRYIESTVLIRQCQENETMNKNIGIYNGNWKNSTRPSLDDVPCELGNIGWWQIRLDLGHDFMFKSPFPHMVERGAAMVADVVRQVTDSIAAEIAAQK